jgi:hypothetical protein
MIFRFYYRQGGGHTHMKLWVGERPGSLGLAGSLVMKNDEFREFKRMHEAGIFPSMYLVEFHEQEITGLDYPQQQSP